jgi:polyhydroxybutyrate depolymerase
MVDGKERSFISVVPATYDANTPHALVLAFHGRTSPAEVVRGYYDLEPHAAKTLRHAIFVYPRALRQSDGTFGWWEAGEAPDDLRDFRLFDALLRAYSERYCLDLDRVYAVGHSLGGSFVNALGCQRASVLRAVASLGGGPSGGTCEGPVAAMVLHNPNDQHVAFTYGEAAKEQYRAQNRLTGTPLPVEPRSLSCQRYGHPGAPNPLVWCPHTQNTTPSGRYYPHQWPRGTGEAIIRFFSALP